VQPQLPGHAGQAPFRFRRYTHKGAGARPRPEVGRLLAAIDEAAGAGELHTQEEAIQLARKLQEEGAVAGRDRTAGSR
jgi:hypothetical protein